MLQLAFNGAVLAQTAITGVQRFAREVLVRLQAERSLRTTVYAPAPGGGSLRRKLWEQYELPRAVRHDRMDLLFSPANMAPIRRGPWTSMTVIHDLSYCYFPAAYSRMFRWFYSLMMPRVLAASDVVLTVSESERAMILQRYPQCTGRLHVVYNGIGPEFFPKHRARERFFLYVGSLSERKNFQGVLAAFAAILPQTDCRLVVIGDKGGIFRHGAATQQLLAGIPEDRITFLGQVNDSTVLRAWYNRALCLVFPSFYESFGLPCAEALACGCPVIASDIPALREVCGEYAWYCNPHDTQAIARQMLQAAGGGADEGQIDRAAMVRHAQGFSWEKTAEKIIALAHAARTGR